MPHSVATKNYSHIQWLKTLIASPLLTILCVKNSNRVEQDGPLFHVTSAGAGASQTFIDIAGELSSGPDGTAWLGPWSSSEPPSPQVAAPQAFPHDLGNRVVGFLLGNSRLQDIKAEAARPPLGSSLEMAQHSFHSVL